MKDASVETETWRTPASTASDRPQTGTFGTGATPLGAQSAVADTRHETGRGG